MRFKESIKRFTLPKGWAWAPIEDLANLSFSSVDKKSVEGEKPVRLCNYMDVFYNRRIREGMPFMVSTASDSDIKKFTLNKGDVVLTKDSETPEEIAFAAVIDEQIDNLVCGYHLAVLRPDKAKVTGEYLMSAINFHPNHHQFERLANGATRFGLGIDSLRNALLPLPPLAEQRKIAVILRTWDEAIEAAEAELKAKQERKRWQLQHALTRETKEVKNLNAVGHYFHPLSERNSQGFAPLSVTQDAGVVLRSDMNRRISYDEETLGTYKVVRPNNFIISLRSFEGGIEMSNVTGCVSPAYQVFGPNPGVNFRYFRHYFKSQDFIKRLAVTVFGIRDGKQISYSDFSEVKIPVLSHDAQAQLANVADAGELDIYLNQLRLSKLRAQKRGLMQKLLTGEVRVAA